MNSIQIVLLLVTSCVLLVSGNRGTYNYGYGVNNPNTGDVKEQQEVRDHDQVVSGYYKTLDADGLMRTVNYQAHPVTGFHAQVNRDIPSTMDMHTGTKEPAEIALSPSPILRADSIAASPGPIMNVDCEPISVTPSAILRTAEVKPTRIVSALPSVEAKNAAMWQTLQQAVPAPEIAWQSEKFIETEAPIYRAKLGPVPMFRTGLTNSILETKFASSVVHDAPAPKVVLPYGPSIQQYIAAPAPIAMPKYYTAPAPIALPKYFAAPAPLALPKYYAAPAPIALPKYYAAPAPIALPKYYAAPAPISVPKYYSAPAPLALPKYYAAPAPLAQPKYYAAPAPVALPKYYASSAPLIAPLESKFISTEIKAEPIITEEIAQEPCEK